MILVYPHNADWNRARGSDRRSVVARRSHARRTSSGSRTAAIVRSNDFSASSASIRAATAGRGWLQPRRTDPGVAFTDRDLLGTTDPRVGAGRRSTAIGAADRRPIARGSTASSIPTTGASSRRRHRPALYAADDAQSCARRHARAGARRAAAPSRPAEDRAARARDARAVRRQQPRDRRRIPEGRTALRRAREAERRGRRAAQVLRGARSHPRRRRLQHAAAADAVGHRAARATLEAHGIPVRVDLPGVGQNLQDRYEVAVVNRMNFPAWDVARGRDLHEQRSAVPRVGRTPDGRLHDQRRGALGDRSIERRAPVAGSVPATRIIGRLRRLLPRLLDAAAEEPELSDLGRAQGAHEQHRRRGHAAFADPREPPLINFRYFEEGNDADESDLEVVVAGRRIRPTAGRRA